MPNSYKIALALALLLCAVVTGTYLLRNGGDGPTSDADSDAAAADASPDASPRADARSTAASQNEGRPAWANGTAPRNTYQPTSEPGSIASGSRDASASANGSAAGISEEERVREAAHALLARSRAMGEAGASDRSEAPAPNTAAPLTTPRPRMFTVGASPAASAGVESDDTAADTAATNTTPSATAGADHASTTTSTDTSASTTANPASRWSTTASSNSAASTQWPRSNPATTPSTTMPSVRTTPPTRTTTTAAASVPSTYTVQAGDTFVRIAQRVYGHERHWVAISQANPRVDPQRLQVGQELRMPTVDAVRQVDATRDSSVPQDMSMPRHTVEAGDTLTSIAQRHYGSSTHWRVIYNANRVTIGPDPDRVRAGMSLLIPPAPSEAR